ncbi:hypothetical protein SJ059_34515, partial [Klebsiella aerogenes]|nr:hypothetical protein [Klebsiella aerogenes]
WGPARSIPGVIQITRKPAPTRLNPTWRPSTRPHARTPARILNDKTVPHTRLSGDACGTLFPTGERTT